MIGFTDEQKQSMAVRGANSFIDIFAKTLKGFERESLLAELIPLELEEIEASEKILPPPGVFSTKADDASMKASNQIAFRMFQLLPKYGIQFDLERMKRILKL